MFRNGQDKVWSSAPLPRSRMRQRREHLATRRSRSRTILHDRVTACRAMLVPEPLEHSLRRVALLTVDLAVTIQPAVSDPR